MITLTEVDAAFIRAVLNGFAADLQTNDDEDPEAVAVASDTHLAIELVTYGSRVPDDDTITDACHCNQPDENRDHRHQRGDINVCRDTIDAGSDQ